MKKEYSTRIIYGIHMIACILGLLYYVWRPKNGFIELTTGWFGVLIYISTFPLTTAVAGIADCLLNFRAESIKSRIVTVVSGLMGLVVLLLFILQRVNNMALISFDSLLFVFMWIGTVIILCCFGIKFILQYNIQSSTASS